jgi:tetratricopeptide (TPR) repeat protein
MTTTVLKRYLLAFAVFVCFVVVLAYRSNPSLFMRRVSGSFEYVRRGEELLDNGQYKEAISCFEKAFRSSPESDDIKRYLAWAYSRYGIVRADAKDYDSAIEYFEKARELVPSRATIQNLAFMHSKKALELAGKGDWAGAMERFRAARSVASESVHASKNLARFLLASASDEYNSGKAEMAIRCLKESSLIDEMPETFGLLGEIYYKKADFDKALFYWGRAQDLDPEDMEILEKLEMVTKEMELARAQKTQALPHFDIRYERPLPFDIASIDQILEKAYFDIGKDFSYFPDSKTAIVLYSEKDFRDIFKLPALVRAFYDGTIRMPLPESAPDRGELPRYLYHEYTHAVVSALSHNRCPAWFNEGIAMWEEFKEHDFLIRALLAPMRERPIPSLGALDEAFSSGKRDEEMETYYAIAYTAVKFIVDGWGASSLKDIMKRLADGQHVINAIDDECLLSEKEFEKKWHEYVRKRYL